MGSEGCYIFPDTGDRREDMKYIARVDGRDLLTDQENAKIIAKAPQMLAALEQFYIVRNRLDAGLEASYSEAFDMAERATEGID